MSSESMDQNTVSALPEFSLVVWQRVKMSALGVCMEKKGAGDLSPDKNGEPRGLAIPCLPPFSPLPPWRFSTRRGELLR